MCRNRRARRDYKIEQTFEAGLVLEGSEVKSLRQGNADLKDSYGAWRDGEIYLVGMHIAIYDKASRFNHDPRRDRKLLLHRRAIQKLGTRIRERGYTLVPLEVYFSRGWAKVLLGLAKGRRQHDRRDAIRERDERRDLDRTSVEEGSG